MEELFADTPVLHLEPGSGVSIKSTVCLHDVPKLLVRKQIGVMDALMRSARHSALWSSLHRVVSGP